MKMAPMTKAGLPTPGRVQPNLHQYVERHSGAVIDEELFADRIVNFLYSTAREQAPFLFNLLLTPRFSSLLGYLQFDLPLAPRLLGNRRFLTRCGLDLGECLEEPAYFTTPRRIFERQIRYWQCRPMPESEAAVVSPADARLLLGSLADDSPLRIKDKFFSFAELFGLDENGRRWAEPFRGGDFAILRLTPDKYHYNHLPVSGQVAACYEVDGLCHSCNPGAITAVVTPYSKNRRTVTIIDTEVEGGSRVGLVAIFEVTALMIGEVVQCYSDYRYDFTLPLRPGMFLRRGQPKSLYRPGSSTDILFFEPGRVNFADDLLGQRQQAGVESRFSRAFGAALTESEVRVRSLLAWRAGSQQP